MSLIDVGAEIETQIRKIRTFGVGNKDNLYENVHGRIENSYCDIRWHITDINEGTKRVLLFSGEAFDSAGPIVIDGLPNEIDAVMCNIEGSTIYVRNTEIVTQKPYNTASSIYRVIGNCCIVNDKPRYEEQQVRVDLTTNDKFGLIYMGDVSADSLRMVTTKGEEYCKFDVNDNACMFYDTALLLFVNGSEYAASTDLGLKIVMSKKSDYIFEIRYNASGGTSSYQKVLELYGFEMPSNQTLKYHRVAFGHYGGVYELLKTGVNEYRKIDGNWVKVEKNSDKLSGHKNQCRIGITDKKDVWNFQ